jgi:hypothetical protein
MAATRSLFWTVRGVEVGAAILWLAAFVSFSLLDWLYHWWGQLGTDAGALILVFSGGAFLLAALRLVRGGEGRVALPARLAYGVGVALFVVGVLRRAQVIYLHTRMVESAGLEGVSRDARFHVWLLVIAMIVLGGGAAVRWLMRGSGQAGVA